MSEPIQVTNSAERSRFEARLGGDVAFADYELKSGQLVLPHTVVPPAFEGKGVASGLAKAAFGYARAQGLKVVPTCTFMAGWVKKHPEEQDLLDPSSRKSLGL